MKLGPFTLHINHHHTGEGCLCNEKVDNLFKLMIASTRSVQLNCDTIAEYKINP